MSDKTSKADLQKMYLAGTVTVPPRLPGVSQLTFEVSGKAFSQITLVKATQEISPKVTITRTFFLEDVKAIFVPDAGQRCDLKNGQWFAGPKAVSGKVEQFVGKDGFDGVIFVREDAQSLLETKAGLTAAENAEYYPPLPEDRSVSNYNLKKVGCLHDECDDFPGPTCCGANCCIGGGGGAGGCNCGGGC